MEDAKPATGRVAVITGAAQGIGRALAQQLYSDGFSVALGDINERAVAAAAQDIGGASGRAIGAALDVTSATSVDQFVATVVTTFGSLDVLVNNAGVVSIHRLQDVTEAEWDRVHDVNLKGVFLCCRAALPLLTAGDWGRIVNIASDSGKRGDALVAHYAASKFGVIGLTQSLAMELINTGVTVNAICPATTDTPMMREVRDGFAAASSSDPTEAYRQMVELMPMGRVTQPADVANALSWLVADASEFITGQAINVTGGRWMH